MLELMFSASETNLVSRRKAESLPVRFPRRTVFNLLFGALIGFLLYRGLEPLVIRPLLSEIRGCATVE